MPASRTIDADRYRHITGDYYWDTAATAGGAYLAIEVLTLIFVPPVGFFLLAFETSRALTSRATIEARESSPFGRDVEPAVREARR